MPKRTNQSPLASQGEMSEGGPSQNTRNKKKAKASINVSPENSVNINTAQPLVNLDTGPRSQKSEIARIIVEAIAKVIPAIIAGIKDSEWYSNRNSSEHIDGQKQCSLEIFMLSNPSTFNGERNATKTMNWLEEMEAALDISAVAEQDKVKFAAYMFESYAVMWWSMIMQTRGGREEANKMSWVEFKELVLDAFCPVYEVHNMVGEFLKLEMRGLEHKKYTRKFNELSRFVPHLVTPESDRISRYVWGLAPEIRGLVEISKKSTFQSVVNLAGSLTESLIRQENETVNVKRKWDGSNDRARKEFRGNQTSCKTCGRMHYGRCKFEGLTCFRCKKIGHIAFNCPNKGNV